MKNTRIILDDFKTCHDFAWAIDELKRGRTVRRGQWQPNPRPGSLGEFVRDFVILVPRVEHAKIDKTQAPYLSDNTKDILVEAHLVRGTIAGLWIPNWMPSVGDLLAEDWGLGPKEYLEHKKTPKLAKTT